MNSIKSKILKLQALVERGEKYEAANAKRLLDKFLSRYGLTIEDVLLEKEETKWYKFNARKKWEENLLFQCYYRILDVNKVSFKRYKGVISIELTAYQYAELSNYYDWNKNQLSKELKRVVEEFTEDYILRHNITCERDDEDDEDNEDEKHLTSEEKYRLYRIYKLVESVEDTSYRKMIE